MPSLPIIRAGAIFAFSDRSQFAGATRVVRVLGLVARPAKLDAWVVCAVARLGDRDAAESTEGTESEHSCHRDLCQSCHRLPPCSVALRG
jgi:hypothetical protein